jgi:hypothetical protein
MLKNAPNNFTKFFFLIRSIFIQDTKHYQTANGIIKLSTAWIFSGFTSNPMHKNVRKRRIGGNKGTNETSSNSVVDALNPMFLFRRCVPWKTSVFFPFSHAKGRDHHVDMVNSFVSYNVRRIFHILLDQQTP